MTTQAIRSTSNIFGLRSVGDLTDAEHSEAASQWKDLQSRISEYCHMCGRHMLDVGERLNGWARRDKWGNVVGTFECDDCVGKDCAKRRRNKSKNVN